MRAYWKSWKNFISQLMIRKSGIALFVIRNSFRISRAFSYKVYFYCVSFPFKANMLKLKFSGMVAEWYFYEQFASLSLVYFRRLISPAQLKSSVTSLKFLVPHSMRKSKYGGMNVWWVWNSRIQQHKLMYWRRGQGKPGTEGFDRKNFRTDG